MQKMTTETKRKRGQRGPGKKPARTKTLQVRLTEAEFAKVKALGGCSWIRRKIADEQAG